MRTVRGVRTLLRRRTPALGLVVPLLVLAVLVTPTSAALVGAAGAPIPAVPPHAASVSATPAGTAPLVNVTPEGWLHISEKAAPVPSPRDGAATAFDARDGYLVLFGGCTKKDCPNGETWRYQDGGWFNLTPGLARAPAPRTDAAMVYDASDGYLLLFGGLGAAGPLSDTWIFQYGQWTPLSLPSAAPVPPARTSAGITYDAADSDVLLFGGAAANGAPLGDTWGFAGGLWTNLTQAGGAGPAPRSAFGLAYDPTTSRVVLFGGTGSCGMTCGDTWSFAQGHWTNLTSDLAVAPLARSAMQLSYDPGRGLILLYGGQAATVLADTWGFTSAGWVQLATNLTASPGTRADASGAFDGADGYYLLFGGHTATATKLGTWAFLTPLATGITPQFTTLGPNQADEFVATPTGGFGNDNVSWNFGDGTAIVAGPYTGHTFLSTGTYVVTETTTDSLGVTASAQVFVTVRLPALSVTLTMSPAAPLTGEIVTLTATAAGGSPPYAYHWSGGIPGCNLAATPAISCTVLAAGTYPVGITVTDVVGHAANVSGPVVVRTAPGATVPLSPSSSAGASITSASWFTALFLALAITAACVVGVVTYRVGRAREAVRNAQRPLCYAVPAWSETPPEYGTLREDDPAPESGPLP
jgi:hypothetical protein